MARPRLRSVPSSPPATSGAGGDDGSDDLEVRVRSLEIDVSRLDERMATLATKEDLAKMETSLMYKAIIIVLGGMGLAFAVARFVD